MESKKEMIIDSNCNCYSMFNKPKSCVETFSTFCTAYVNSI